MSDAIMLPAAMDNNQTALLTIDVIDAVFERLYARPMSAGGYEVPNETEVRLAVEDFIKLKNPQFSTHNQRLTHFILFLNTKKYGKCIIEDGSLDVEEYLHGKLVSGYIYYIIVDTLNLNSFIAETIRSAPFGFCSDLVDIILNQRGYMNSIQQLSVTEDLILSMLKSVKRVPVGSSLENTFLSQFTKAMVIYTEDHILPNDVRRFENVNDQKVINKYYGLRLNSLFKIVLNLCKFKTYSDSFVHYPLYKVKSKRQLSNGPSKDLFNICMDRIMHKCIEMCQFSVDFWLAWYEVEVEDEDTNLQSAIGHKCFELNTSLVNFNIDDHFKTNFPKILVNLAIEKIDLTNVNISNIDEMISLIERFKTLHLNPCVKKFIQNPDVFKHTLALEKLNEYVDQIDYNCFKTIIDRLVETYNNEGNDELFQTHGGLILKGIQNLDMEDKMSILKYFVRQYGDKEFKLVSEYDELLKFAAHNEFNPTADKEKLMSDLIWLTMQNPKKMLHLLISQYIGGIFELPVKGMDSKRGTLHRLIVNMHLSINNSIKFQEYSNLLKYDELQATVEERRYLRNWITGSSRLLRLFKPKEFIMHVLIDCVKVSPNYNHLILLIQLTKFFFIECQSTNLPESYAWKEITIQIAKIMNFARWTFDTYSDIRYELCEKIIDSLPSTFKVGAQIASFREIESVKDELMKLKFLNRSHFLHLWTIEHRIQGMEEEFIMTAHSENHISYSFINEQSPRQKTEEFIFTIATYFPKFTLLEMRNFVTNFLNSSPQTSATEAAIFLLDSVMNAIMRIIVYLKIALPEVISTKKCAWANLHLTIVNFLDSVNFSKMAIIYHADMDVDVVINCIRRIIMVIKQLDVAYQEPLFITLRRIIQGFTGFMNLEKTGILLDCFGKLKNQIKSEYIIDISRCLGTHMVYLKNKK